MRIANSNVSMASYHEAESFVSVKKASIEVRAGAGAAVRSGVAALYESSGGSMVSAMEQYYGQYGPYGQRGRQNAARGDEQGSPSGGGQASPSGGWRASGESGLSRPDAAYFGFRDIGDLRTTLLNKLLEVLSGGKGRFEPLSLKGLKRGDVLDLRGSAARAAGMRAELFSAREMSFSMSASVTGTTSAGTLWQRVTATSYERSEREYTAFRSNGCAVTEDGRSISFGVEFAMSRSFSERFDSLSSETYLLTDPLIINLDSDITSVSDTKFLFDLDADGQEEEISFAGKGSGFLALDANGNGVIDDGSELFGTKSGDGFADLAAYDEDGNGWIDENDDVYSKLRVWVKDADGSDRLLTLKEANVGAIYLGSVSTEFSLNDAATTETNGVMRRSGVYLKETGEAGTISHVDLRC